MAPLYWREELHMLLGDTQKESMRARVPVTALGKPVRVVPEKTQAAHPHWRVQQQEEPNESGRGFQSTIGCK